MTVQCGTGSANSCHRSCRHSFVQTTDVSPPCFWTHSASSMHTNMACCVPAPVPSLLHTTDASLRSEDSAERSRMSCVSTVFSTALLIRNPSATNISSGVVTCIQHQHVAEILFCHNQMSALHAMRQHHVHNLTLKIKVHIAELACSADDQSALSRSICQGGCL